MIVKELFAKLGLDVDEGAFSAADAAIGGLRSGLVAVGAALAGVGIALAGAVKKTANTADNIDEIASRVGVSTDALQELGYAASFGGVGLDELAVAMNFMAKKGTKDVQKGIGQVADRIKELTDQGRGAEAAAFAMEKLGRGGARLIPVLKGGSAELARMAEEARAFGLVMDEETIATGVQLNDSLDRVNHSLRGLIFTIAGPLMSPLREVVQAFAEWVGQNRKLIAARVDSALKVIGIALKTLWKLAKPFLAILKALVTNTHLLKAALIALAVVMAAQMGAAISRFVVALGTVIAGLGGVTASSVAAAGATLLLQLAWFALAAAIALAIEDIYVFFQDGDSLLGRFGPKFMKFVDEFFAPEADDWWLTKQIKAAILALSDLETFWNRIKNALPELFFGPRAGSGLQLGPTALAAGFGGGASPTASVANALNVAPASGPRVLAPQVKVDMQLQAAPGMNAQDFADAAASGFREEMQRVLNDGWNGLN